MMRRKAYEVITWFHQVDIKGASRRVDMKELQRTHYTSSHRFPTVSSLSDSFPPSKPLSPLASQTVSLQYPLPLIAPNLVLKQKPSQSLHLLRGDFRPRPPKSSGKTTTFPASLEKQQEIFHEARSPLRRVGNRRDSRSPLKWVGVLRQGQKIVHERPLKKQEIT